MSGAGHDHDVMDVYGAAREDHRHYGLERELAELRERVSTLASRVYELEQKENK